MSFMLSAIRFEHNDPIIEITVCDVDLICFGIDLGIGRAPETVQIVAVGLWSGLANLQDELSGSGEFQILTVVLAIAADPYETRRVDRDAVLVLRPVVALARTAPGPDQIAVGIELHYRRRRPAAFRLRRIERERFLVVGKRAWALNHPDMILSVYGDAGRLSHDPIVRQRLGPGRVDREARDVFGAGCTRSQGSQNESERDFHCVSPEHFALVLRSPDLVVTKSGAQIPGLSEGYRAGGFAANFEPRTQARPRASCQSFSAACRWPSARAMVRKS